MVVEITDYESLLAALLAMTPEQRKQDVQVGRSQPDSRKPTKLKPVHAIGTVGALGVENTRSSVDNDHHPEAVVIMFDFFPFANDGAMAFDLMTGERFVPKGVKSHT